ncbi:MAG: histidine--tRNA ligase [Candidatus Omnitrophica bacterium]|nr:histidine--tRNA ligase [Candidatus Omnitrophota bacterium]
MKISSPRGTSDILPCHIAEWHQLETTARTLFKTYGYSEIRTPVFEDTGLFKRSLGESTEVVNKQLLEIKSQRAEGASDDAGFALRPEGTAPVVRAYNQYDLGREEFLSKLFYMGPMFRGERPQKGRLREFHQIGAEAIGRGANHPLLDAEIIALCVKLLKGFGLNDFKLKINSLGSAEDKKNFANWLRAELKGKIDHLGDESKSQYERNVFRLLDSKDPACKEVINTLEIGSRHLSEAGLKYFEEVKKGLDQLGVVYEVSSHLVRGLDYYTHTVFEIAYAGLGAQDALGAGGRYNGLIEQLGGGDRRFPEQVGAMGFALGMERILLALEAQGKLVQPKRSLDVFVVAGKPEYETETFGLVHELRQGGLAADMDFGRGRAFKKQFEQANKLGARFVIILGEEELKNATVGVKNMTTGEQTIVDRKKAVEELSRQLERL